METRVPRVSIGFVSAYPPTVGGLATYIGDIIEAFARDAGSLERAIDGPDTSDTVSIQHGFGISAGPDGQEGARTDGRGHRATATSHTVLDGV